MNGTKKKRKKKKKNDENLSYLQFQNDKKISKYLKYLPANTRKPYYNCLYFVKTTFDRQDLIGLTFTFHNSSVAKGKWGIGYCYRSMTNPLRNR